MCGRNFPHSIYIFHFISFIHHHQAGKDIKVVGIVFQRQGKATQTYFTKAKKKKERKKERKKKTWIWA